MGAPALTKPQRLWSKDGHLQQKEAAAVYSVKRHFLSVGLEILTGTNNKLLLADTTDMTDTGDIKQKEYLSKCISLSKPDNFRHE